MDVVKIGVKEKYGVDFLDTKREAYFEKMFQCSYPIPSHKYSQSTYFSSSIKGLSDWKDIEEFLAVFDIEPVSRRMNKILNNYLLSLITMSTENWEITESEKKIVFCLTYIHEMAIESYKKIKENKNNLKSYKADDGDVVTLNIKASWDKMFSDDEWIVLSNMLQANSNFSERNEINRYNYKGNWYDVKALNTAYKNNYSSLCEKVFNFYDDDLDNMNKISTARQIFGWTIKQIDKNGLKIPTITSDNNVLRVLSGEDKDKNEKIGDWKKSANIIEISNEDEHHLASVDISLPISTSYYYAIELIEKAFNLDKSKYKELN